MKDLPFLLHNDLMIDNDYYSFSLTLSRLNKDTNISKDNTSSQLLSHLDIPISDHCHTCE
jgi:hypothetical protein